MAIVVGLKRVLDPNKVFLPKNKFKSIFCLKGTVMKNIVKLWSLHLLPASLFLLGGLWLALPHLESDLVVLVFYIFLMSGVWFVAEHANGESWQESIKSALAFSVFGGLLSMMAVMVLGVVFIGLFALLPNPGTLLFSLGGYVFAFCVALSPAAKVGFAKAFRPSLVIFAGLVVMFHTVQFLQDFVGSGDVFLTMFRTALFGPLLFLPFVLGTRLRKQGSKEKAAG
jgi:hypothetical protein